jgi:hypothetical protein
VKTKNTDLVKVGLQKNNTDLVKIKNTYFVKEGDRAQPAGENKEFVLKEKTHPVVLLFA